MVLHAISAVPPGVAGSPASFLAGRGAGGLTAVDRRFRVNSDADRSLSRHRASCGSLASAVPLCRATHTMSYANHPPNPGDEPRIGRSVSLDHAAALLGVSRRTIYNRIRDGRLQTIRTAGGSQR